MRHDHTDASPATPDVPDGDGTDDRDPAEEVGTPSLVIHHEDYFAVLEHGGVAIHSDGRDWLAGNGHDEYVTIPPGVPHDAQTLRRVVADWLAGIPSGQWAARLPDHRLLDEIVSHDYRGYALEQIHSHAGRTWRVRIHRDAYAHQSHATVDLLDDGFKPTRVLEEPGSNWHARTPTRHDRADHDAGGRPVGKPGMDTLRDMAASLFARARHRYRR